jgi:hypothetical protein
MAEKNSKTAERQERLAAQLRANLKKRKAQLRERAAGQAEDPAEAAPLAPAKTVR